MGMHINTRARKKITFIRDKKYTILPALLLDGFLAVEIMEGNCDKERFCEFILLQVILVMNPFSEKNSVIVLDNAKIHQNETFVNIVEELGCHVIFLLPYSPDYNPIETAFSNIKSWIKRNRDFMNAANDPFYAFIVACAQITSEMVVNFFHESDYLE
ncbi:5707_t:CDS:2 [Racocetra fulgida]|uniref:5707_t:CDS:1 n=1 Tax=Racocetra fulgida TaxID=60492 RepID=A0A9N9EGH7_9GLOM|nr:5707_t:CDS:2 [Racocetra fulgida]